MKQKHRFHPRAISVAIVCASILTTAAAANSCPAKNDLTLVAQSKGKEVVEATVQKIQESEIFPNDNQFLRRIAFVESKDGSAALTYGAIKNGKIYYGGIWQVDEPGFEDTQDITSHPGLKKKFDEIKQRFGIDWGMVTWQDLEKPLYSGLAARLFLSNVEEPIPPSSEVELQGQYWKMYYNKVGNGTADKFVKDVSALNEQTNEECSSKGNDVIFVLDSSGSIGLSNFQNIQNFVVNNFVSQFTIGPLDTRVGIIVFSDNAIVAFSLDTYDTAEDIISATQGIAYIGGGTDTAAGLNRLVEEFNLKGRPTSQGVARIAIVVTDGKSNDPEATASAANNVHQNNIIAYAVGIGDNINPEELAQIAGTKGEVENTGGFGATQLESLQSDLNQKACKASTISEIEESISSTIEQDQQAYFQYNDLPEEGVTLKLTTQDGSVAMYATDKTPNPSEALYDVKAETSSYTEVYINRTTLYEQCLGARKKRQALPVLEVKNITLYVTIAGQSDTNNSFTLNTTYNDTTTPTQEPITELSPDVTTIATSATPASDLTTIWVIVSGAVGGALAILVIAIVLSCCCYLYHVKQRIATYTV